MSAVDNIKLLPIPIMKAFILTLLCAEISNADWALVGQPHSFVCTGDTARALTFTWRNSLRTTFLCDSLDQKCHPAFNELLENYTVIITSNASTYMSVFTIKSVMLSHHNTTWYCNADIGMGLPTTLQYTLNIFAPPSVPLCYNVTLRDDIYINVRCYTEMVFPEAVCDFKIKTNNTETVEASVGSISYILMQSSTEGYIRTECTYTLSAANLGAGSHVFYVVMHPPVTSIITEEMERTSQGTNIFILGFPEGTLAPDCRVNDYIKENQNSSCTCYDNSQTFLPTKVTWLNGASQNGTLSFLAKRPSDDSNIHICTISNQLNWTNNITYHPKVAYGPNNVIIKVNNFSNDDCETKGIFISGTCTVSDSSPDPTVSIYVSNTPVTSQSKINKSDYQFNQVIAESGIFYVLCRAVNSVFREIYTETVGSVAVKGPPKVPQISSVSGNVISLTQGNQLQVAEGVTDIVCESKGGYPLYKNITLECLIHRKSNENSDTVRMSLNVTGDMQGMNCTCAVWHESKCFNNFVTVNLKLLKEDKNNVGAIIGGVIAAVVGVVFLVVLTVLLVRRRSNKKRQQSLETNINKMQNYSNIQGSDDYVNYDSHYERPVMASDNSTSADVSHQTSDSQTKLKSNSTDYSLGGFIKKSQRSSKRNESTQLATSPDKETDEEHPYDEIHDSNT